MVRDRVPVLGDSMSATRSLETARSASELSQLQAERQRLAEALSIAERDRQLLGYEIHDSIVQDLTAAAMLLDGAARHATFSSAESQESFATGLRLLRESIAGARQLIGGLTPVSESEADLRLMLRRLVNKFRTDHSLPVTFESGMDELRLPGPVAHMLARIAQEALFNVWKHSQAAEAVVRIAKNKGELVLSVSDNGVGFDTSQRREGHFGLEGIRARAQTLGAQLTIDSSLGRGTRLTVMLTAPPA